MHKVRFINVSEWGGGEAAGQAEMGRGGEATWKKNGDGDKAAADPKVLKVS